MQCMRNLKNHFLEKGTTIFKKEELKILEKWTELCGDPITKEQREQSQTIKNQGQSRSTNKKRPSYNDKKSQGSTKQYCRYDMNGTCKKGDACKYNHSANKRRRNAYKDYDTKKDRTNCKALLIVGSPIKPHRPGKKKRKRGDNNNQHPRKREKLQISEEEYNRRRNSQLCLRCGKAGHRIRNCPSNPRRHTTMTTTMTTTNTSTSQSRQIAMLMQRIATLEGHQLSMASSINHDLDNA